MRLTQPVLIEYIKKMINERVAMEDQQAFAESLASRLDGNIFLSDIDIEKKYGDLLTTILHDVNYADETEGINPHLIAASISHAYMRH